MEIASCSLACSPEIVLRSNFRVFARWYPRAEKPGRRPANPVQGGLPDGLRALCACHTRDYGNSDRWLMRIHFPWCARRLPVQVWLLGTLQESGKPGRPLPGWGFPQPGSRPNAGSGAMFFGKGVPIGTHLSPWRTGCPLRDSRFRCRPASSAIRRGEGRPEETVAFCRPSPWRFPADCHPGQPS